MTVLGNIVAVTSIIAVVSLIQGLNASVKQAILNQAGADSFNIQQFPITQQRRGVREGPRQPAHHAGRRARDPALRQRSDRRRDGRFDGGAGGSPTATSRSTTSRMHGVSPEYVNFSTFDAERGPADEPDRGRHARGRSSVVGWQTADRLFGTDIDPLEKIIQIEGVHFRIVGVSAKRGIAARPVAGRVRRHPARPVPDDLRRAALAVADRASRATSSQIAPAMDEATVALRVGAPAQAEAGRQLRHLHVGHVPRHLPLGHQRHLRGAGRRRRAVARGRRHRHHEHHADGGHRADARDRPAQGARRPALRHHGADADRVGGAVDVRRRRRHDARRGDRADDLARSRRSRRRSKPGRWRSASASPRSSACSSGSIRRCARRASIRSKRCGRNEARRHGDPQSACSAKSSRWRSTPCAATRCARR